LVPFLGKQKRNKEIRGQAEKQEPQNNLPALIFAHNFYYFLKVFASSPFRLGSLLLSFYQKKESKNKIHFI